MFALLAILVAPLSPGAIDCGFDRDAMLALDQAAFDQDMGGGWRAVAGGGCDPQAADLIRDWRSAHTAADTILLWHQGQLRASAGQYAQGVTLFEQSRKPVAEDRWGWNLYVDGSIAFLRGDRASFDDARAKLAGLPRPADLDRITGAGGKPVIIRWPMNLHVLEKFARCWGRPYKIAHQCPPATPPG
ncbi:hypothetical protein [Sphingomonas sp.]|uniref:hypothetical protein n=1 Tax=Sphingomonas sp. TaxID=28214 RepID=UPI002CE5B789|nr:hypothetical protein [Sphingomonas sp.]HWK36373.1 hypothetical protein [Sphingomonas sp.]